MLLAARGRISAALGATQDRFQEGFSDLHAEPDKLIQLVVEKDREIAKHYPPRESRHPRIRGPRSYHQSRVRDPKRPSYEFLAETRVGGLNCHVSWMPMIGRAAKRSNEFRPQQVRRNNRS